KDLRELEIGTHSWGRHDTPEERRVAPKADGVNRRLRIRVGAVLEEPLKDLGLVLVHAEVQQRGLLERRAVNAEAVAVRVIVVALRINLLQRERTVHKIRSGLEMLFEKIDPPAMDGHRRRVG